MNISDYYNKENVYPDLDKEKAVKCLSSFIQCQSVSNLDQSKMDFGEFQKIHSYIDANYPYLVKYSTKTVINQGSVYYTIQGKNPDLPALVLMGHIDVVPPIQLDKWEYGPFSGQITEDYIYGRGALDMKDIDCCNLNAIEYFLSHFGRPEKNIYFCLGHDEETLGMKGQYCIKEDLKAKGAKIGMVVDEGGGFLDGARFGSNAMLAHVQVMEKGYLDVELTATSKGGHSSRVGATTALGRVAHAIAAVEDHPFASHLNEPLKMFYKNIKDTIADEKLKDLVENIDTDPQALIAYLEKDEANLPLLKTTIAATMISSDSKGANVLPQKVTALINLRLSDADKVDDVVKKITDLCAPFDVSVKKCNNIEASAISSITSDEYHLLEGLIQDYFKNVVVVPNITVGGTDCCFYNDLCDNCYRFSPIVYPPELGSGVHGVNEHVAKSMYLYGLPFVSDLIKKYCM